jgi:uncharacterized radical SAM superfamily Fe-S cluster-containing enzyme
MIKGGLVLAEVILVTQSLCPYCFKKIPARYEVEHNQVYFYKECDEHGPFRVLFWRDADHYLKWLKQSVHAQKQSSGRVPRQGCPYDCGLCQEHEGGICTAVLEITYRCNMECRICFADATKTYFEPGLDEIQKMYETVLDSGNYCSIQLSGGEPTLREDLPQIIALGKKMGFPHIQINTNGLKIAADLTYVRTLKEAGADLIYLQFDGTKDRIYEQIRGKKLLAVKQKAVANCAQAGIGVLLVPTVVPRVNLDNIGAIIEFAKVHLPTVKGVHFQPVSYFGRYPAKVPADDDRVSLYDVIRELEVQTRGEIAAKDIVPRKRYDAHCAFSSLYYLSPAGKLLAITKEKQNRILNETTDFAKKTNVFTNAHWRMAAAEKKEGSGGRMAEFKVRLRDYTLSVTGMGFADIWNFDLKRLQGCCVHVITKDGRAAPLCAFHVTGINGERLYQNG